MLILSPSTHNCHTHFFSIFPGPLPHAFSPAGRRVRSHAQNEQGQDKTTPVPGKMAMSAFHLLVCASHAELTDNRSSISLTKWFESCTFLHLNARFFLQSRPVFRFSHGMGEKDRQGFIFSFLPVRNAEEPIDVKR